MDRSIFVDYKFNEVNETMIRSNNNNKIIYTNNNLENDREEASDTTRRKLSKDGSTTACDT